VISGPRPTFGAGRGPLQLDDDDLEMLGVVEGIGGGDGIDGGEIGVHQESGKCLVCLKLP